MKKTIYENNPAAKAKGPLSIGVPGELAGLHTAWLQHGRIAWKTLFQPSIKLARDGYVVTRFLAAIIKSSGKATMGDPVLREIFAPKGKSLEAGGTCYNPKLALTLEMISEEGPRAFYHGTIGERLARDVQEAGGILTMEDLRHYKVEVSDAMTMNSMGYTILGMAPPSSGTVGLAMDNQLTRAVGASGGLYIIPVVIQVFLNHFVFGMDPLAAVQHPRVYHKLIPNVVLCEDRTFIDGDHIELPQETGFFGAVGSCFERPGNGWHFV